LKVERVELGLRCLGLGRERLNKIPGLLLFIRQIAKLAEHVNGMIRTSILHRHRSCTIASTAHGTRSLWRARLSQRLNRHASSTIAYLCLSTNTTSPPEQLSHDLAERFATKCFSPLELTHFKDNFRTLADSTDGLRYWKEETLCRFLNLPDALLVGPVIFQMATYLGAFPFPSLAPSILTLESMVKVVVIMTERYGKVLKRGRKDRGKLLFRSLAVFDRRMTSTGEEKPKVEKELEKEVEKWESAVEETRSHVEGFAVDKAANDDDEDEDDDELALAALDSLDAIEVFKHDQKIDTKMQHALVPRENLQKLILLLLVIAPLGAQENISTYAEGLSEEKLESLRREADCILAAFNPDPHSGGVSYKSFVAAVSTSLPHLFDPLNYLFEHFLFSKNMDLSRKRGSTSSIPPATSPPLPPQTPILPPDTPDTSILTPALLAHLSFCLPTPSRLSLFHNQSRFHPLYSTATHGTSLTSLSRQVLSWQSPTLLLLSGTPSSSTSQSALITLGAYLPTPWKKSSSTQSDVSETTLFMLAPTHTAFPTTSHSTTPLHSFDLKGGISFGCTVPPSSRTNQHPIPALGPVSLLINADLEYATFTHSLEPGASFTASRSLSLPAELASLPHQGGPRSKELKLSIEIDTLEVWGITTSDEGVDEVSRQLERLNWEEREAERRARVNFGTDREGAKALLDMAGITGQHSGGSMG
jgi:hypothetical protein